MLASQATGSSRISGESGTSTDCIPCVDDTRRIPTPTSPSPNTFPASVSASAAACVLRSARASQNAKARQCGAGCRLLP